MYFMKRIHRISPVRRPRAKHINNVFLYLPFLYLPFLYTSTSAYMSKAGGRARLSVVQWKNLIMPTSGREIKHFMFLGIEN